VSAWRRCLHACLAALAGRKPAWPSYLAAVYLGAVLLVWLLTWTVAERQWWTTLLLYFPQGVFLGPAVLTLPPALWKRDRRALLLNGLALLVVAWPMMGLNIPLPSATNTARAPRVRLLAYNIEIATDGMDRIGRQVEKFRPDVVVFAEARRRQQAKLDAELRRQFPGWDSVRRGDVFIASRWSMIERESAPLPESIDRENVRALVQAPFGRFHVAGVHMSKALRPRTLRTRTLRLPQYLDVTGSGRWKQARAIEAWTAALDGPVLLAGDFNTPPAGHIYGVLTRRYEDSFKEAGWGWGFTFPSKSPLLRIDYIFHSAHWKAMECRVGARPGSDHRPVFAELALVDPEPIPAPAHVPPAGERLR
jgi:vancomycin resistance protein VanJ